MVILKTNMGDIVIDLNTEKAPITCENFLKYVRSGHYNGTIFHRLTNDRLTVAMARTNDPHSATSQFFINTVDNDFLNYNQAEHNWGYCVFGKVVSGADVVYKIEGVKTDNKRFFPHRDVPVEPVVIESCEEIDALPESK